MARPASAWTGDADPRALRGLGRRCRGWPSPHVRAASRALPLACRRLSPRAPSAAQAAHETTRQGCARLVRALTEVQQGLPRRERGAAIVVSQEKCGLAGTVERRCGASGWPLQARRRRRRARAPEAYGHPAGSRSCCARAGTPRGHRGDRRRRAGEARHRAAGGNGSMRREHRDSMLATILRRRPRP